MLELLDPWIDNMEENMLNWDDYSHFISKSRISSYRFCPLQFKKNYIDGIRGAGSYATITGTRFHEFADKFFDYAHLINPKMWAETFIHECFCPYEVRNLEYFLEYERARLAVCGNDFEMWMPYARELRVVNEEYGIRGIIDRIDLVNDKLMLVEYKTSKSINKPSLQREFGFYKLLLKDHPVYGGYELTQCCVINPRVKAVEFMNPSRLSTIEKDIAKLKEAIETNTFKPACTDAKYFMCKLCKTQKEANLYQYTEEYYSKVTDYST